MKYKIALQSVSDVITNSSSEIYTIKTNVGNNSYEIGGTLSYSVMCNVNESISGILRAEFGKYNVSAEY